MSRIKWILWVIVCIGCLIVTTQSQAEEKKQPQDNNQVEGNQCTDKCKNNHEKCMQLVQGRFDKCVERADKWKEQREKVAEKSKNPEQAKEKLQVRYDRKKEVCGNHKTFAMTRCDNVVKRCNKRCEHRAAKKKNTTKKKLDEKKPEAKKPEAPKPETKKPEAKKPEAKKPELKK